MMPNLHDTALKLARRALPRFRARTRLVAQPLDQTGRLWYVQPVRASPLPIYRGVAFVVNVAAEWACRYSAANLPEDNIRRFHAAHQWLHPKSV